MRWVDPEPHVRAGKFTRLCVHMMTRGACRAGTACNAAHEFSELHPLVQMAFNLNTPMLLSPE